MELATKGRACEASILALLLVAFIFQGGGQRYQDFPRQEIVLGRLDNIYSNSTIFGLFIDLLLRSTCNVWDGHSMARMLYAKFAASMDSK
jgi:hypothetical protein